MSIFKTIDEAREYFSHDHFCMKNGITLDELGEDWCVCSMCITEEHQNANGGIMGGVIFTLADFAFSVASNQVHKPTVAQQVSINYISSPKGSRLIAHAKCRKDGRTTCIYNIDVTDDTGRDIAQFIGTSYKIFKE